MAVIESFHRRRVDGIITASSRLSSEHLSSWRGLACRPY